MINSGEAIGIIGESGTGKSTLANLLVGLMNPSKGDILIDGNSIHNEIKKLREERFDIYPFNKQTLRDVVASCKDHGNVECLCGTKIVVK